MGTLSSFLFISLFPVSGSLTPPLSLSGILSPSLWVSFPHTQKFREFLFFSGLCLPGPSLSVSLHSGPHGACQLLVGAGLLGSPAGGSGRLLRLALCQLASGSPPHHLPAGGQHPAAQFAHRHVQVRPNYSLT